MGNHHGTNDLSAIMYHRKIEKKRISDFSIPVGGLGWGNGVSGRSLLDIFRSHDRCQPHTPFHFHINYLARFL